MADIYRVTGSDGACERFVDKGAGTGTNYWARRVDMDTAAIATALNAPPYPLTPVVTVYSPTGAAYMKVTPNAANLNMVIRPRVTSQALIYAPLITHKVADATSISATVPAVTEGESYALSIELADDFSTHIVSTVYHATADTALVTTNATSEATLVAEVNATRAKMLTHFASTSIHGGVDDATSLATVTATSACTDAASAIVLENVLVAAHAAHLAVTDGGAYITAGAVGLPINWPCLGAIWVKTDTSSGVFTAAEWRSV
jgi:hypothetical protein